MKMDQEEFRKLLQESVRLEVEVHQEYNPNLIKVTVRLVSTEDNSSFDPIVIMEDRGYLST